LVIERQQAEPRAPLVRFLCTDTAAHTQRLPGRYKAIFFRTHAMPKDTILSTARTLPYPPQAVYAAFASGPTLASWWGPEGFTNTFDTFDFTVGGQWVFTMHGPDGKDYANTSFFAGLEPATRIVIRHDCPPHFTLTVSLTPVDGGTHLVWEQAFDDAETAQAVKARVGSANEQNLDKLTRALSRANHQPNTTS
jgi:uncharacterized protein YndB with AHSA1/START domain